MLNITRYVCSGVNFIHKRQLLPALRAFQTERQEAIDYGLCYQHFHTLVLTIIAHDLR